MNMFKRKISFISAICPECKGNLQLDSNLETAFCQYCGAQCIVENTPKRSSKSKLETILSFIERQQSIRRCDKQTRQKKIEESEAKKAEHLKTYAWAYILLLICLFAFSIAMAILENLNVI